MAKIDSAWITNRPIAHRGLHDGNINVMENSIAAAEAAIEGGYAIELDLQPASDAVPMVFHDFELDRLTGLEGITAGKSAKELSNIAYLGGDNTITPFTEFLKLVDGRADLVVELKGKDEPVEGFVEAVVENLSGYTGNAALMSFQHWVVNRLCDLVQDRPVGLTAYGDDTRYEIHNGFIERCPVDFVSYELKNIDCRFVKQVRAAGLPVISWTVRSPEDQAFSDQHCDQITFEGFLPA